MSTRITVVHDNPVDPAAFDAGHLGQLALPRWLPGIQELESATVWPEEVGGPTPAYRLLDLHITAYDATGEAVTPQQVAAFFPAVLRLATGGVRTVLAEVEEF